MLRPYGLARTYPSQPLRRGDDRVSLSRDGRDQEGYRVIRRGTLAGRSHARAITTSHGAARARTPSETTL